MEEAASPPTLKVPGTFGRNRLRGKSEGALVHDQFGTDHSDALRQVLREEARRAGIEPTERWVANFIVQLLALYEKAHEAYRAAPGDTIGHVYEACFPSGRRVLMGEENALRLVSATD